MHDQPHALHNPLLFDKPLIFATHNAALSSQPCLLVGRGGHHGHGASGGVHVGHGLAPGAGVAGHGAGGLVEVAGRRGRADGHGAAHGPLLQAAPHEEAQDQGHGDHQQRQQREQRGVAAPVCVRAGVCVRARSARPAQSGKEAVHGGRDAERAV